MRLWLFIIMIVSISFCVFAQNSTPTVYDILDIPSEPNVIDSDTWSRNLDADSEGQSMLYGEDLYLLLGLSPKNAPSGTEPSEGEGETEALDALGYPYSNMRSLYKFNETDPKLHVVSENEVTGEPAPTNEADTPAPTNGTEPSEPAPTNDAPTDIGEPATNGTEPSEPAPTNEADTPAPTNGAPTDIGEPATTIEAHKEITIESLFESLSQPANTEPSIIPMDDLLDESSIEAIEAPIDEVQLEPIGDATESASNNEEAETSEAENATATATELSPDEPEISVDTEPERASPSMIEDIPVPLETSTVGTSLDETEETNESASLNEPEIFTEAQPLLDVPSETELLAEINRLTEEKESLSLEISRLKAQNEELERQNTEQSAELENLQAKIAELESNLAEKDAKIVELDKLYEQTKASLANIQEAFEAAKLSGNIVASDTNTSSMFANWALDTSAFTKKKVSGFINSSARIGTWKIEPNTASQTDASQYFSRLEMSLRQDKEPTVYKFKARSTGKGWVGLGLHIFAENVRNKQSYGEGKSLLVWLTRDPAIRGDNASYLQLYRSDNDVVMERMFDAELSIGIEEWHAIEVLYDPEAEYIAISIDGALRIVYKTFFEYQKGGSISFRTLGASCSFSDFSVWTK